MNILIGSDPELFATLHGQLVSAYGLVQGDKEHPFLVDNGAVQVDGMALEFNIDPAATEEEWVFNLSSVMAQLEGMIGEHKLAIQPVAEFGSEYIEAQPDKAKEMGCDPDYNAWIGKVNPSPDGATSFRTAAGHIHIGWTEDVEVGCPDHDALCRRVVKQLDFYLGLPSLVYDSATQRREMYGCAGAYRPKPYGCEYRVLSNKWLESESLTRWVYRSVQSAMLALQEGRELCETWGDVQHIINTSDVEAALAILTQEGLEVPHVS